MLDFKRRSHITSRAKKFLELFNEGKTKVSPKAKSAAKKLRSMLNKSMEQMPDDTDDAESASFWNQILGSLEAGKVRDVSSESELKTLTDDLKSQLSDYWSGSELKNAEKLADEIAKGVSYT